MGANQENLPRSRGATRTLAPRHRMQKDGAKGSDWQVASVFCRNNPVPK